MIEKIETPLEMIMNKLWKTIIQVNRQKHDTMQETFIEQGERFKLELTLLWTSKGYYIREDNRGVIPMIRINKVGYNITPKENKTTKKTQG